MVPVLSDGWELFNPECYVEKLIRMGNALTAVIVIDGQIAGTWKRTVKKVKPEMTLFRKLNKAEQKALQQAEDSYLKFFQQLDQVNFRI